jgi:hypothetical protein
MKGKEKSWIKLKLKFIKWRWRWGWWWWRRRKWWSSLHLLLWCWWRNQQINRSGEEYSQVKRQLSWVFPFPLIISCLPTKQEHKQRKVDLVAVKRGTLWKIVQASSHPRPRRSHANQSPHNSQHLGWFFKWRRSQAQQRWLQAFVIKHFTNVLLWHEVTLKAQALVRVTVMMKNLLMKNLKKPSCFSKKFALSKRNN